MLSVLIRDDSRMCTEGTDAVGHVARLNYDKEREIQRLAATIIIHQVCCSTKFIVTRNSEQGIILLGDTTDSNFSFLHVVTVVPHLISMT